MRPQPEGQNTQRMWIRKEKQLFAKSLPEMSRLYANEMCEVLVSPQIEPLSGFMGTEEPIHEFSSVKRRECLKSKSWGWLNTLAYEKRGWCVAESRVSDFAESLHGI